MRKVTWGVLSTAAIGVQRVIPPMMTSPVIDVAAIASRDEARAREWAGKLGIARAYGSYEALLADPDIEVIYNPLPNSMHVEWTEKALADGKHVLCETPLGMTTQEARRLVAARDRSGRVLMEAFMVRTHPQWLSAREILRSGRIGRPTALQMFFSYANFDPVNIRNRVEVGGGALMDIGCYPITLARFLFEGEPEAVAASIDRDPTMGTDRLTGAMMAFSGGRLASFVCGTQLARFQVLHVLGEKGRVTVEIPVNALDDRPMRVVVDPGTDLVGTDAEVIEAPLCNQYRLQGEMFSRAVAEGGPIDPTLEDSIANMAVIDAVVRAAGSGRWEKP